MEIYSSVWHLISALLIFLIGALSASVCAKYFEIRRTRALFIYTWHTVFCMTYLWYAITFGGDAIFYYKQAYSEPSEFSLGTAFINYITALFTHRLGASILGIFLIFNAFGAIGMMAFDACLRTATQNRPLYFRYLATVIVFLPSVSFWSSAIGKDSLSFMAAGLALWASLALGKRWLIMAFAVAVMLLVRPHMAAIMVMAWTFAVLVNRKVALSKKMLLGTASVAATAVMVPFALQYAGVGETIDAEELMAYVEERQAYNMEGGGGVDIDSMSLPMQLVTYMFRPFIFEADSIFAFAAAVDNLILLYLFVIGGWAIFRRKKSGLGESRAFMWAYSLLAWATLAMTTANLGIALRQKWMFAPMLIFLLISVIGVKKRQKSAFPNSLMKGSSANSGSTQGRTA